MPCLSSALPWSNCKNESAIKLLYPVLRCVCRGREHFSCVDVERRKLEKLQRFYGKNVFLKWRYAAGRVTVSMIASSTWQLLIWVSEAREKAVWVRIMAGRK